MDSFVGGRWGRLSLVSLKFLDENAGPPGAEVPGWQKSPVGRSPSNRHQDRSGSGKCRNRLGVVRGGRLPMRHHLTASRGVPLSSNHGEQGPSEEALGRHSREPSPTRFGKHVRVSPPNSIRRDIGSAVPTARSGNKRHLSFFIAGRPGPVLRYAVSDGFIIARSRVGIAALPRTDALQFGHDFDELLLQHGR